MGAIVRRVCEKKSASPYFKKIKDYPGFEALGAPLATYKRLAIAMYAVDDEEYYYGVRCIATPVKDYRDKCVAAIGISGPSNRITLETLPKMAMVVQEVGKALTNRLSFKTE